MLLETNIESRVLPGTYHQNYWDNPKTTQANPKTAGTFVRVVLQLKYALGGAKCMKQISALTGS